MQMHLLVTPELMPIPKDVTVNEDYGLLSIITEDCPEPFVKGNHMIVTGTEEAIKNWLRPHDGFWLGKGPIMLQQFEIAHIAD